MASSGPLNGPLLRLLRLSLVHPQSSQYTTRPLVPLHGATTWRTVRVEPQLCDARRSLDQPLPITYLQQSSRNIPPLVLANGSTSSEFSTTLVLVGSLSRDPASRNCRPTPGSKVRFLKPLKPSFWKRPTAPRARGGPVTSGAGTPARREPHFVPDEVGGLIAKGDA